MRLFLLTLLFVVSSPTAWSQSIVPPETKINHAWVQGVYWNPQLLPGWGFFVDVQEETLFGAIYGYMGNDSTFITLQGKMSQLDPLRFTGDVYFVTQGGGAISDVGNFTWSVTQFEASPAASLSISSNILNRSNLQLVRFVYSEIDKIDTITGADWDIVEHILITFGSNYAITDERFYDDGQTYVIVGNNDDDDDIGVASYFPSGEGDAYALMIPLDVDTDNFYVFYATDSNLYGRFWLLDDGESPTNSGYYFHGSIASMQAENNSTGDGGGGGGATVTSDSPPVIFSDSGLAKNAAADQKALKELAYDQGSSLPEPMFSQDVVSSIFERLSRVYRNETVSGGRLD